jgi:surfactin synthase thioesterase subunit
MNPINVIFLPFAGGSKYSYNGFVECAPDLINVVIVDLPGRGTRYHEPLLTDIERLVDDVYEQIRGYLDQPYAIYGHSMGTLLGYLLTRKLERENHALPLHLFFTGCVGPSLIAQRKLRHRLPKKEFLQELQELGGSPDEILRNEKLMEFFEPILRADFQAIETYVYQRQAPLDVPITVLLGTEDVATPEDGGSWQTETRYPVEVRKLPGKHFFIFDHQPEIMNLVVNKLFVNAFHH